MSEGSQPAAFTAALDAVLERVLDPAVAQRLERVYTGADRCIAGLRGIDLSALEAESSEEGGADLGLFEQVAPAVGQTLSFVSALIQIIQTDFPENGPGDDGLEINLDEENEIDPAEKAKTEEASFAIRAAAKLLQKQVAQLGMGVRNPEVVASRWGLLNLLQSAIGRFYGAIGDMVYASAVAFGEVKRADIVPFHKDMLNESLTMRRAAVDLGRVTLLYQEKLKAAVLSEMAPLLVQLENNLSAFAKTPAYKTLWAHDKERFLVFRSRFRALATGAPDAEGVRALMADFVAFTAGLINVNNRQILKDHDREVAAACAAKLEQAELMRAHQPSEAAGLVAEVLRDGWELYGRDPELDTYLRQVRKRGAVTFTPETLAEEIAQVTALVARVPIALFSM